MIIIYTGEVGVYLKSLDELEGAKSALKNKQDVSSKRKWYQRQQTLSLQRQATVSYKNLPQQMVATKTTGGLIGEKGLLLSKKRRATCIALTNVKALYLSKENYQDIIESFHRAQIYKNVTFQQNQDFGSKLNFKKLERLSGSYNTTVLQKDDPVVKIGCNINQMFILKSGELRIQKRLKISKVNYWPSIVKREPESRSRRRNRSRIDFNTRWDSGKIFSSYVVEDLDPIVAPQIFGLHEIMRENSEEYLNIGISVQSEKAVLLTINKPELFSILDKSEIKCIIESNICLKIPSDD